MIVVDTNVISELWRREPNKEVMRWFDTQVLETLHLCAPVIFEIAYGAERAVVRQSTDRYRKGLERLINDGFAGRILPLDTEAARWAGLIRSNLEAAGKAISAGDALIAGICRHHGMALATRNMRDFEDTGVRLINPFGPAPT